MRLKQWTSALVILVGCSPPTDAPIQPEVDLARIEPAVQEVLDNLPAERGLREMAQGDPSFAGYFIEGDSLVVLSTRPDRGHSLRSMMDSNRPVPESPFAPQDAFRPIAVRHADYSFRELAEWRSIALTAIAASEEFVGIDLNEGRNRITIFIATPPAEQQMRSQLAALAIPPSAIEFEISGRGTLLKDLGDHQIPAQGGYQVYPGYQVGGQKGACSIGFNAMIGTNQVFITASHCTLSWTSLDSYTAFHPSPTWKAIGHEWLDPPDWSCVYSQCRLSDAAAFLYDMPADSIDFGRIARPLHNSTQIDIANPYFEVIGKWSANPPPQYSVLHKVGQKTGWTTGVLWNTCVAVEFDLEGQGERTIYCLNKHGADVEVGDSGGPVFTFYNEPEGTISLAGIITGSTSCCLGVPIDVDHWYSDFTAIEAELGSLWVWPPAGEDPLTVSINGPSQVPTFVSEGCIWGAAVIGGTPPYSYAWEWDDQLVSTDEFYFPNGLLDQGQHWLEVTVNDASSSDSDGLLVQVDPSYSCF